MAFQPAVDIAQVTIEGRQDNQLTINDLYFFSSGAITASTLLSLATNVSSWVTFSFAPLLSDDWSCVRVRAVDLSSNTGLTSEVANTAVGGTAGEAAPNNVAACVSIRTAQRGRSGRGRNFVPGVPNSLITLNTLDAGWIADLLAAYSVMVGAGDFVVGWQWVVLSRQFEGELRPAGLGLPVVSVSMVGNSVRSMRSREIGHGA